MRQIKKYVFLTLLSLITYSSNSYAGFEFSNQGYDSASEQIATSSKPPIDTPMPIVDMPSVTSMPIENEMNSNSSNQEVYIKRKIVTPITPRGNEPFDSKGLLEAMQNGGEISIVTPSQSNSLVINPYPLEKQASHNNNNGFVDQAIMEESGMLRPVAIPGRSLNNRPSRQPVEMASRENAKQNPILWDDAPRQDDGSTKIESLKLTPMIGGEAQPIEAMIQKEKNISSPMADQNSVMIDPTPTKIESLKGVNQFSEAAGFGRDLPLALALSQIVPPEYSYAFGETVNTGTTVSWQGGKSWDKVLDDMLAPAGLMAIIQNNQVTIRNKNS